MNYRHAYHAGNHADVVKHIVVARLIEHLKKKEKGFLFLDAHAGIGVYDLASAEAVKTGEWRGGLGKWFDEAGAAVPFDDAVEALIAPWRAAVAAVNSGDGLRRYPGSPMIAGALLRPQDRLALNELHPQDVDVLRSNFAGEPRVRVSAVDAAEAIRAALPPPTRRGLVLIDPPYEHVDEAARAASMLASGLKRFATGVFALWHPVTGDGLDERLEAMVAGLEPGPTLRVALCVRRARAGGGLAGSGMIIVNPPWTLSDDLALILPALAARLGEDDGGASWRIEEGPEP